jgi:hypothetical protein
MADDDFGCPELWDEYQWERFLQQQDQKTEQYFALFEKYMNHPDRDEIIAREMGWGAEEESEADEEEVEEEWVDSAEVEGDALEADEEEEEESEDAFDELHNSEVYMQSMELNRRVFAMLDERNDLRDNPVAVELAARVAVCGAKIAAALCGDDSSEVGMTIAYLKRALKAATDALNATHRLADEKLIEPAEHGSINELLFPIRETLVDMMGEFRAELRRRRGED